MPISARMYLDEALLALADHRFTEAGRALDTFVRAVEAGTAGGPPGAPLVEAATRALLELSARSRAAAPLELALRLRRIARLPLDAATTAAIAASIEALPPGPDDAERLAYCSWMRREPASFTERRAVLELERARA